MTQYMVLAAGKITLRYALISIILLESENGK